MIHLKAFVAKIDPFVRGYPSLSKRIEYLLFEAMPKFLRSSGKREPRDGDVFNLDTHDPRKALKNIDLNGSILIFDEFDAFAFDP